MTFISRAARYVLRKRVRTAVLFIVLTIHHNGEYAVRDRGFSGSST